MERRASNWSRNGVAAVPVAGDQLVFAGTTQTSTQNDLVAAKFQSIEFQGSNLPFPATVFRSSGNITVDSGATADTISLGMEPKRHNNECQACPRADSSLTIAGDLSGKGGLTKIGGGALTLDGTNSFGGLTRIAAGTLLLESPLGA